jgi:LysR family glycine cleavage system transcriptional activator
LNSLRAFEAAARHQSLSRAADELAVTHGAISRQVAKLEEFLDAKLFERRNQQVILTKKGAAYAARLQLLFDEIHDITARQFDTQADRGLLRIGVLPTFAMRILVPRLARFKKQYPDLKLQVDTYSPPTPNDPAVEVDVAIWLGHGEWPNFVCEQLFPEELLPVASPSLVADQPMETADDLEPFLLLHALHRPDDWKRWLDIAGATKVDPQHGLRLEYSGLVYQGAVDGLGLAMAQTLFIRDDIAHGRLRPLFDMPLKTGRSYYLVYHESDREQARIVNFAKWLKEEIAELLRMPVL